MIRKTWHDSKFYRPKINATIIVWDDVEEKEKPLDCVPPFWEWDAEWWVKWPKWAYARTGMRPIRWNVE